MINDKLEAFDNFIQRLFKFIKSHFVCPCISDINS